jgi:ParB/RepB/Spo0J family partition protein
MTLESTATVTDSDLGDTRADRQDRFAVLPLDLIVPSRTNPRTVFDPAKLLDLAESIKASGVHQPILVRPLPPHRLDDTFRDREPGHPLPEYEIVSGERRYRASKAMAGVDTIPAMIRTLSDTEALEIQIVENLQRADLTELEEAEGYQRLCDTTGIAKEAVGERIGKSRSYVYGRMKLLDLTSAPREALRNGDIDASKALLIARIPDDKQQLRALEAAREKDHQGSPRLSYRALQTWVQQNVMLKLSAATFPITDATLVPAAGPCPACPKRTGANPDLFADVDGPDLCIDPACFHAKEEAHNAQLVAAARAKGMEVIDGRAAKEVMPNEFSPYLKGYSAVDRVVGGGVAAPLRDVLTKAEQKKIAVLVAPSTGKLIEVVPDDVYSDAVSRAWKAKATPKDRQQEAERQAENERVDLERDYQWRWRKAAIDAITPRIKAGEIRTMSAPLMRTIILELSGALQRCNEGHAARALGLDEFNDDMMCSTVRALDDNEVGFALVLTLLNGDSTAPSRWIDGKRVFESSAPIIEDLASQLALSLDEIKATIQAEIRAERAKAEAPKKPKAGDGKRTAPPAARAPRAKPSANEVQDQIAKAFQVLEEDKDQAPDGATPEEEGAALAAQSVPSLKDRTNWPFPPPSVQP